MAWPAPRRIALFVCVLAWILVQILFFLPAGGFWKKSEVAVLSSRWGDFQVFRVGREAVLWGAFSDRYQRLPRMELIPFLRKKGITRIARLIITGHDSGETGALIELQKNFKISELNYPPDSALKMRQTFKRIGAEPELKRLQFGGKGVLFCLHSKCVEVDSQGSFSMAGGDWGS